MPLFLLSLHHHAQQRQKKKAYGGIFSAVAVIIDSVPKMQVVLISNSIDIVFI